MAKSFDELRDKLLKTPARVEQMELRVAEMLAQISFTRREFHKAIDPVVRQLMRNVP
jgi:hypothetical protein